MKEKKTVRLGKSEVKVLKALYKIDNYTNSGFVAEKSKIPKNQTYQILRNLQKKGLSGKRSDTVFGVNQHYLTEKGFKKLVKNKHITPKHNKKYDRWL